MKKYFLKETGEELTLGKPFSMVACIDGLRVVVNTKSLSQIDIATLESLELVSSEKVKTVEFDVLSLIQHYAERNNSSFDKVQDVFAYLYANSPKALLSILLKEAEILTYEGQLPLDAPGWEGNVYFVDSTTGKITSANIKDLEPKYRDNVSLFRSKEDLEYVLSILSSFYKKAFNV